MKIAVTIWNDRIAPVFDVARDIRLVEVVDGRMFDPQEDILTGELPVQKALQLVELGVDTLICGAISRPVGAMIASYGIQVVPFVAGNPEGGWVDREGLYQFTKSLTASLATMGVGKEISKKLRPDASDRASQSSQHRCLCDPAVDNGSRKSPNRSLSLA